MSLISPAVVHIVRMTQITINMMWVEYEILKFFLFKVWQCQRRLQRQYHHVATQNHSSTPFPPGLLSRHLSVSMLLFHAKPPFHPHPSACSLLLCSFLSTVLLLNPRQAHQWGVKFWKENGRRKAIFQAPDLSSMPLMLVPTDSISWFISLFLSLCRSPYFTGRHPSWQAYWESLRLETKLFLHIKHFSPEGGSRIRQDLLPPHTKPHLSLAMTHLLLQTNQGFS